MENIKLEFKELEQVNEKIDEGYDIIIETFEDSQGWTKYRLYNEGESYLIKAFDDKVVMLDNFSIKSFNVVSIDVFNQITKKDGLIEFIRSIYDNSEVTEVSEKLFEDDEGNLNKDIITKYLSDNYYSEINEVMKEYLF